VLRDESDSGAIFPAARSSTARPGTGSHSLGNRQRRLLRPRWRCACGTEVMISHDMSGSALALEGDDRVIVAEQQTVDKPR
jgi:hypothetical protein